MVLIPLCDFEFWTSVVCYVSAEDDFMSNYGLHPPLLHGHARHLHQAAPPVTIRATLPSVMWRFHVPARAAMCVMCVVSYKWRRTRAVFCVGSYVRCRTVLGRSFAWRRACIVLRVASYMRYLTRATILHIVVHALSCLCTYVFLFRRVEAITISGTRLSRPRPHALHGAAHSWSGKSSGMILVHRKNVRE